MMQHMPRSDHLTIECSSTSKPSLLSSYWSINVQVQNNEKLEFDIKSCSQFSLPEVASTESKNQKLTRSLSVTNINNTAPYNILSPIAMPSNPSINLSNQLKENPSHRVVDWLTNLDISK